MKTHHILVRCALVALVLTGAGCRESPTAPAPAQALTPPVVVPKSGTPVLLIDGPSTIVVGKIGLYEIEVKNSDGSRTIPSPADAVWTAVDPTVVEIRKPFDSVYGRSAGVTSLVAQWNGLTATYPVRVIEKGQFLVSGVVSDAQTGEFLQAKIQAQDEAGVVIETWSDMYGGGRYAIDVNPGTVRLTISNALNDAWDKTYTSQTLELVIDGNIKWNFALKPGRR